MAQASDPPSKAVGDKRSNLYVQLHDSRRRETDLGKNPQGPMVCGCIREYKQELRPCLGPE